MNSRRVIKECYPIYELHCKPYPKKKVNEVDCWPIEIGGSAFDNTIKSLSIYEDNRTEVLFFDEEELEAFIMSIENL